MLYIYIYNILKVLQILNCDFSQHYYLKRHRLKTLIEKYNRNYEIIIYIKF